MREGLACYGRSPGCPRNRRRRLGPSVAGVAHRSLIAACSCSSLFNHFGDALIDSHGQHGGGFLPTRHVRVWRVPARYVVALTAPCRRCSASMA